MRKDYKKIADTAGAVLREQLRPLEAEPLPKRSARDADLEDRLVPDDGTNAERSDVQIEAGDLAECATAGIATETQVIVYCFKGARASSTFVALEEAGIKNVGIYFGSGMNGHAIHYNCRLHRWCRVRLGVQRHPTAIAEAVQERMPTHMYRE